MKNKTELSYNDRLDIVGIKTIRERNNVFLEYDGKRMRRPTNNPYVENNVVKEINTFFNLDI